MERPSLSIRLMAKCLHRRVVNIEEHLENNHEYLDPEQREHLDRLINDMLKQLGEMENAWVNHKSGTTVKTDHPAEIAGIINNAEDEVWETLDESRKITGQNIFHFVAWKIINALRECKAVDRAIYNWKIINASRECEVVDRAIQHGEMNKDESNIKKHGSCDIKNIAEEGMAAKQHDKNNMRVEELNDINQPENTTYEEYDWGNSKRGENPKTTHATVEQMMAEQGSRGKGEYERKEKHERGTPGAHGRSHQETMESADETMKHRRKNTRDITGHRQSKVPAAANAVDAGEGRPVSPEADCAVAVRPVVDTPPSIKRYTTALSECKRCCAAINMWWEEQRQGAGSDADWEEKIRIDLIGS